MEDHSNDKLWGKSQAILKEGFKKKQALGI